MAKNKTKDRMKRQTDDLVTLAALSSGEGGTKEKDQIGSLNKWLETIREGYTKLTPQTNDVPYGGEIPKFSVKVIAGNGIDDTTKKSTSKK